MAVICARLGIALIHARPCHAAGKGKIERYFRTVRGQFLAPLEAQGVPDLETLNRRFRSWLESEYRMSPHRGLDGDTPLDRWARTAGRIRYPDPGIDLERMFLFEASRKAAKARTVSLLGRVYEVDPVLQGQTVTLRYDPAAPPSRPLLVVHDGKPAGTATLLDLFANTEAGRGSPGLRFGPLEDDPETA